MSINYLGYIQVSIDMASIVATCGGRNNVLMFVCPDTAYSRSVPVVLGINVLDALCDSSDRHQGTHAVVGLLKFFQAVRALHNDEDGHVGKVTVSSRRAVVIQQGCTVSVRGKCRARQLGGSYPAVADGPTNAQASRDGPAVVSSLVTVSQYSHSTVGVPVHNSTGHDHRRTSTPGGLIYTQVGPLSGVWGEITVRRHYMYAVDCERRRGH